VLANLAARSALTVEHPPAVILGPLRVLVATRARRHSAQRKMPPESYQNRRPAPEHFSLPFRAAIRRYG
jgi:hypothetical protein